jgi:hypothetical protein
MSSPSAPPQMLGAASILSPTFREEQQLEKQELATEKKQAKDSVSSHQASLLTETLLMMDRKPRLGYGQLRCFCEVSTLLAV